MLPDGQIAHGIPAGGHNKPKRRVCRKWRRTIPQLKLGIWIRSFGVEYPNPEMRPAHNRHYVRPDLG